MALATMLEILGAAQRGSYCVGYFEAWDEYSLQAVWEAAQRARAPVFLGFGAAVTDQAWLERWGIELLIPQARLLAEKAPFPAAVLFNEAQTLEQARRALDAGANAVMADTSGLPLPENIRTVRRLVEVAQGYGAEVEGELGQLSGLEGRRVLTDPGEAARFVRETGVHALAVSAGSVHALAQGEAQIDLELLRRIREATAAPLVLHGGSGIASELIARLPGLGVAKINYGTRLKIVFAAAAREAVQSIRGGSDIHRSVGSRTDQDALATAAVEVRNTVEALMRQYGSAGRA